MKDGMKDTNPESAHIRGINSATLRQLAVASAPGLLSIALSIGDYKYPNVADLMLLTAILGYVWVFLTLGPVDRLLAKLKRPYRARVAVLTVVALTAGPAIYHFRHPPPEYPDVVAGYMAGMDVDLRLLTYLNPRHTIENVRIVLDEHAQDRIPTESAANLGTFGPYGSAPLKWIRLRPPKDTYWVNVDTTEGKFAFALIFEQQKDGTWSLDYSARVLGQAKAYRAYKQ
jgi:hypothetical protein